MRVASMTMGMTNSGQDVWALDAATGVLEISRAFTSSLFYFFEAYCSVYFLIINMLFCV